jgi:D-alanine-D-alanine ligase
MGGVSSEHDISMASGSKVHAALDRDRWRVRPVVIDRDGGWLVGEPGGEIPREGEGCEALPVGRALDRLMEEGTEAAFLALHGPFGEDGTIQGLLEMAGLPYTGSGVLASSLAMDKERSRWVFAQAGLSVPPGVCFSRRQWSMSPEALVERVTRDVPSPWVVKPADQGSSVGILMVDGPAGLGEAAAESLRHSDRVLVEHRIRGTELTCAVLDGIGGGEPEALPVTLIRPREDAFFDYHAKYTPGATEEITPAPIPPDMAVEIQEMSLLAFRVLGCRGMARFDYIRDDQTAFLLEGNTIPGMTETSLLPQAAEVAGMSFPQLLDRLLLLALEKR